MKGKLIVLEGLDGSGKTTQAPLVVDGLKAAGYSCDEVSYPTYDNDSSAMIKAYLSGEFGSRPGDVNCYAASIFFTVDRYAGYRRYWRERYEAGMITVAARYTTSNMIHQMSKLPKNEWDSYLSWLSDLEYNRVGLPRPDGVVFLDMPVEVSQKLLRDRYSSDGGHKDIHERDREYLSVCRDAAAYACEHQGWIALPCSRGGEPLSVEEIHDEIMKTVFKIIG